MERMFCSLAAAFGFLAVALGAFGAHALKSRLTPELMAIYQTAVQYHLAHALALLAAGGLVGRGASAVAGWAFTCGIILFSGSLYALALLGVRWLGAITPLGGVAFLVGWAALGWGTFRHL